MTIIDRYLLRKFAQTFIICFATLMGLYVVLDLTTNLDEFSKCGEKAGGLLPFVARFYGYKAIGFFDSTSSLLALVSAMFTVAWIQRHNEMTALMAAGVTRIRALLPIIVAVTVISILAAINRETLIPQHRQEIARRSQDPLGDQAQSLVQRCDNRTDVLLRGKHTFADQQRIEEPDFRLPATLQQYGRELTAENAYWKPAEGSRPSGYLLDGVREPKNLDTRASLLLDDRPVLITPQGAPGWLRPGQCFLVSDVEFDQLTRANSLGQLSSTPELIRGLRNPSLYYGASIRVAIHARFLQPLLDVTLLFLGLPLVVSRESRNVFIAMGMSMGVTTAFTLVVIGSQYIGSLSWFLSPALAAWLPLVIFVPPAVGLAESLWN
ncbi:MAG: LptF/LptG family permease [Planctomycetaceae bacterium]|nr:LptF/LptG family permease [Planctomycetaceae bacterium]